jgi:hypothetical protein
MRLSGIGVGLLINFYVTHLRDGIKRMVDGKNWGKIAYPVILCDPSVKGFPAVTSVPSSLTNFFKISPHFSCIAEKFP